MEAILMTLDLIGFGRESRDIHQRWTELLGLTEAKQNADYRRACPKYLLEQAVIHAREATKAIGCRIVSKDTSSPVHDALNDAWGVFWKDPSKYHEWEKTKIQDLRTKYSS
jgi:hypothetical protein